MPVEIFSKAQFEAALPVKTDKTPLWSYLGVEPKSREHLYLVSPFNGRFAIRVHSSVVGDLSEECGENSIRAYIVQKIGDKWEYHGGKNQRWVARTVNWRIHMTAMLRSWNTALDYIAHGKVYVSN